MSNQDNKPLPVGPCPFCGSVGNYSIGGDGDGPFYVDCLECGSTGPTRASVDSAVCAWNDRQCKQCSKIAKGSRMGSISINADNDNDLYLLAGYHDTNIPSVQIIEQLTSVVSAAVHNSQYDEEDVTAALLAFSSMLSLFGDDPGN